LVRTVHSYAFGVLRRQAALQGSPTPRLLSGPEQDAVVRELLAGDIAAGAHHWPAELRGALGLPGFAAELRDLLLRAAERGVGPEQLAKLGRMHRRPQWVAAGRFGAQYEQVTLLQGGGIGGAGAPALDAAELVASALLALHTDAELLATERRRVRRVYLDDAQHLDPLQWRLVRALGDAAGEFVVFGDPDQSIFSFRGADPRLLTDADPGGERTVVLSTEHRMSEAVRGAVLRLASRLPGSSPSRTLRAPLDREHVRHGRLDIRVFAGEAAQAAWLADELRRAHLLTGMRYAEMAVLVRSVPRSVAVLRRAMLAAGVPVAVSAAELPPARHAAVAPLLEVLRVAEDPARLDEDSAELLLGSALGGSDPLQQRRLRRELRRLELAGGGARSSGELLVEALRGGDALVALGETTAAGLRGLIELIRVTSDALPDGLQQGLWRLWQASGLEDRWVSLALRGGYLGAQADRDLDAVVALFEAANRYAERLPGAAVAEFVESLADQQFAADTLAPRAPGGDAVSILSAHAAAGREWSLVALAGVTEGSWPDLRLRGSLLGVEALVDILDGIEGQDTVSATAPLLAEERRLLLVAASRAREGLLIGAVR
ncbi:MAG: UvrD-helicase domain-containing protein, partial [Sciscionella sp.]